MLYNEMFLMLHILWALVTAEYEGTPSNIQRQVIVQNRYDHPVTIEYNGGNGGIFMADIGKGRDLSLQTSVGHQFFVKKFRTSSLVIMAFIVDDEREIVLKESQAVLTRNITQKNSPHRSIRHIPGPRTTSMYVMMKSLSSRDLDMWFDDGTVEMNYQGSLRPGDITSTNAKEGDRFVFTEKGQKRKELMRFTLRKDQVLYVFRDDAEHSLAEDVMHTTDKHEQFIDAHYRHSGIHWRANYDENGPRPPPVLHMWEAHEIGQTHGVASFNGYWNCDGPASTCQSKEPLSLELEVVSVAPRVFVIEKFLSDFEADSIIALAVHNASVTASTVGDYDDTRLVDTRTSRNTWISRQKSPLTETLFRRAADTMGLHERTVLDNAEQMQVVHYVNGQKYDAHHDWGVSGYHESRFITMLLYLTDQADPTAGGETAFPKAGTGGGIKVVPVKGDAVLFYNLLEDGNGDDLALHAALPVWRGEKWLANFWVWDSMPP